tara:strand:- start:1756 stop:1989 length:234 start_codon:yes stop_codon:yes gene_type:complete
MVVVAMVTDLTIVTVTIPLVDHIMVVDNRLPMDKQTIHIDINLTQRGVLVEMDLSMVTEVLEGVKVLLWSKNSSDKY